MAKEVKKGKTANKGTASRAYSISGGKLVHKNKSCPKCGEGYLLAEHKNRHHCGHCNYTEFKN